MAVAVAALALSSCGGGGGGGGGSVTAPLPTPTPTPTQTSTPTPTPSPPPVSAIDATKARLKAAAANTGDLGTLAGATATVARQSGPTTIGARLFTRHDSDAFRFVGTMVKAGDAYPLDMMVTNHAVNYGSGRSSNEYFIEFETDAPVFEVVYQGNGYNTTNRVYVDGRLVDSGNLVGGTDGDFYVSRVTLPVGAGFRRIRVQTTGMNFYGVNVATGQVVRKPAANDPIRAVILGDSYTEGNSGVEGVNPFDTYASQVARRMGWGDFYKSGVGSTGYLAAPSPRLKLRDRLATDVFPFRPEVIVIAAGINDELPGLQQEASATFDAIRVALPDTIVIVVGPWNPRGGQVEKAAAIRAAVGTRTNFHFVDNVGEGWQSGTRDGFVGPDGVHPTQAGHDRIGMLLSAALMRIFATF